ncbi:hypothetical protein D9758_000597 [Tetrapyrgos nigripes]|uniref:Scamp-domain-containing protein n=1 Tax=Tetrapyrgos nigripes TaxID=182062 RepID=A0A8H5GYS2_9AGAR|nr:hypothetical protein D9758_000597 [Tetrapyrgos nigripes]
MSYNQNPFASSHSLDANPFDDPPAPQADARLEQLRQRELDLERREQELNAKAQHIREHGRKNWPFFYPLIYHDIAGLLPLISTNSPVSSRTTEEIPEASRPLVTRLYQLWLVLFATLIINMVACILILIAGSSDGGRDVGASIGYLFMISITSFLLWYRPIYNGYMKEQSLYYYLYFFFCGWHLIFSIYMIIGIPSTGSAGLIQTIQMFTGHHWVAAIFGLVATVGWILQGVGNTWYYRQIYAHHNAAGHTMEKAKTELASHGAKAYFTRG